MKKTYYLFNPGRLSRKDNTLKFTPVNEGGQEERPRYLPIEDVDQLYIFGSVDANSANYNFLGKQDVAVHFFDYYENYTGSFMPKDQLLAGRMVIAQTKSYIHKKKRQEIAQRFIEGASHNMLKNLNYYNNRGRDLTSQIEKIKTFQADISGTSAIDMLMGIEGNIRKVYYDSFDEILQGHEMNGRSMRPPTNTVNALISFGNMMCYSQCLRTIHQTQLNPTISYLHEPGERRYSLSLDLAEIFKPLLVDRVIFKVLNKNMITDKDCDLKMNKVLLKPKAKKIFIEAFESRLQETVMHRALQKNVSYKHLIKLECYKLQKHLLGMQDYKPFKMWW